ncbi:MAG: STAS domain-containing protein [Sedimentisphaerales bacterium]|nr:STAS domain-containing protein [Sedimentisphaerales bacterium]
MQEASPTIALRNRGQVTIVELLPEEILDESVIAHVEESLSSIADDMAPVHMLLCFTHVRHMSSGALGVLNRLKSHIEKTGGSLKLANLRDGLQEVFRITQLNRIFEIYPDHNTALASYD